MEDLAEAQGIVESICYKDILGLFDTNETKVGTLTIDVAKGDRDGSPCYKVDIVGESLLLNNKINVNLTACVAPNLRNIFEKSEIKILSREGETTSEEVFQHELSTKDDGSLVVAVTGPSQQPESLAFSPSLSKKFLSDAAERVLYRLLISKKAPQTFRAFSYVDGHLQQNVHTISQSAALEDALGVVYEITREVEPNAKPIDHEGTCQSFSDRNIVPGKLIDTLFKFTTINKQKNKVSYVRNMLTADGHCFHIESDQTRLVMNSGGAFFQGTLFTLQRSAT
ncbi:hypothetical protein HK102_009271 [Quaeritorhiza haematococci]|nr:hypothetical protein HK102_009271 [Quaeritorhiza haematococci]